MDEIAIKPPLPSKNRPIMVMLFQVLWRRIDERRFSDRTYAKPNIAPRTVSGSTSEKLKCATEKIRLLAPIAPQIGM